MDMFFSEVVKQWDALDTRDELKGSTSIDIISSKSASSGPSRSCRALLRFVGVDKRTKLVLTNLSNLTIKPALGTAQKVERRRRGK
jgi:hypothetical protein